MTAITRLVPSDFASCDVVDAVYVVNEAVAIGTKIGLMATAKSTVAPSTSAIEAAAEAAGKEIDLKVLYNEDAILALKSGDQATHDRLVLEMADQLKDRDVIVLAQASTAYMEQAVAERSGVTTLSSPKRCIEQLRKMMEEL